MPTKPQRPPGRAACEIKTYPWPVVTAGCLKEVPGPDHEPIKAALIKGLQALKETELWLRKVERASGAGSPMETRALELLELVDKIESAWPLSVVGRPKPQAPGEPAPSPTSS